MICSGTLVASITAAAVGLSEGKSSDEINLLSTVFAQLGDTLATIAAQKDLCVAKDDKKRDEKQDKKSKF